MKILTEKEFAESEQYLGANIIECDGTYWKEIKWKFFVPVHPLKEIIADQRPSLKMPFRLFVAPMKANTVYVVMQMSDPVNIDLSVLSGNTRSKVRRGQKRVVVEEDFFSEESCRGAFEVYRSFYIRANWGSKRKLDYGVFKIWFEKLFEDERLTLGGFVDGHLVGLLRGYLIGDTAYLSFIATHSDYLKYYPNECLVWHFVEKVKSVSGIRRIIYATKSRKATLDEFKSKMGFLEKKYPARFVSVIPASSRLLAEFVTRRF